MGARLRQELFDLAVHPGVDPGLLRGPEHPLGDGEGGQSDGPDKDTDNHRGNGDQADDPAPPPVERPVVHDRAGDPDEWDDHQSDDRPDGDHDADEKKLPRDEQGDLQRDEDPVEERSHAVEDEPPSLPGIGQRKLGFLVPNRIPLHQVADVLVGARPQVGDLQGGPTGRNRRRTAGGGCR